MKLNTMKLTAVLAAAITVAAVTNASATLTLDLSTTPLWHIAGSSNPSDNAIADAIFGNHSAASLASLGSLLYKYDNQGVESGPLAGSYAGQITLTGSGTGTVVGAKITYTGGTVADATYLLVKDGTEGSYVFDVSGWNGTDLVVVGDVFNHGISHVEFFGSCTTSAVPEPGTLMSGVLLLLPFGAGAYRSLRKKE